MDVTVPCVCGRHETDTVTLRERLDFLGVMTTRKAVGIAKSEDESLSAAETLAILTEQYLLNGISAWSLADDKGKPLPLSKSAIRERLLSNVDVAILIADEADALYSEQVLLPLLRAAPNSSPPMPTDESTSQTNGHSPTSLPKPSKRSSITTIRTGDTGTMATSLVGASSFSPSSE